MKSMILLIGVALLADDSGAIFSKGSLKNQKKTIVDEVNKQVLSSTPSLSQYSTTSVIVVDPKVLASDWISAFDLLSERRASNIIFSFYDRPPMSDVSSLSSLEGGYLMLFITRSVHGHDHHIIKTSSISGISTR